MPKPMLETRAIGGREETIVSSVASSRSIRFKRPADGKEITFPGAMVTASGSGEAAASVIYQVLQGDYRHRSNTIVIGGIVGFSGVSEEGVHTASVAEMLAEAKLRGDSYVLIPELHEWSRGSYFCRAGDPATTNNIDVTLRLYDVSGGKLINGQRVTARACPWKLLWLFPTVNSSPDYVMTYAMREWLKSVVMQ